MGTVVPLTFDSTGGGILTALQADQWTDALGPADYEIYEVDPDLQTTGGRK
jgi:hypothetical protein